MAQWTPFLSKYDFRDEAVERKNEAEVELARCRIESMQVFHHKDHDYDAHDGDDDYHDADDDGSNV